MKFLRQRAVKIVLDVALLVGFAAEFITREGPDYDVHSWIGVILIPTIVVHVVTDWRWVTSAYKRRKAHPEWALARFNAVLMIVTSVCIATGFPIWLEWSSNGAWSTIHNVTGFASIVLAISHLWRNRSRVKSLLRRRVGTAG